MARSQVEPLKRKAEIVDASAANGSEEDRAFDLASLDHEDSGDDEFDETGDDASSGSTEHPDQEDQDSDETLPADSPNGKPDGTQDDTGSGNLLSDVSSDFDSTSEDVQIVVLGADGNPRILLPDIDPHYDSDSSTQSDINTIGNIDMEKYYPASMPHIAYDINGRRILRPAAGAALDQLLDTIDLPAGWTGIVDKDTGELKNLTEEELDIIKRIRRQELPHDNVELYDPYRFPKEDPFPLSAAPEPKRRFLPSKHEAIRIMKIVRAIREGKIVKKPPPKPTSQIASYDIWSSDPPNKGDIKPPSTQHIPAPKLKLPGHDESYHPPPEYLPSAAEKEEWENADEEDREKNYLPVQYDTLRMVPAWGQFIKERFERCLDLYLAPRVMKQRLNIDPDSLIPKLPSPRDLRPFPTRVGIVYEGHSEAVKAISVDPSGMWLATGAFDGSIRVWEVRTGREVWKWHYPRPTKDEVVSRIAWNPMKENGILAVVVGDTVYLLIPPVWMEGKENATREVCDKGFYAEGNKNDSTGVKWSKGKDDQVALIIKTANAIEYLTWHRRGDYFATVAPQGTSGKAVLIHQVSRHQSQSPLSRTKGSSIQCLAFHPIQPHLFVASLTTISHYSLTPPTLIRKLRTGVKRISSLDIHPLGDHLLVGSYDKRVAWFDLDLSDRPYKTIRYHERAVRDVAFHKGGVKLFASAGDEGAVQVFWADVGSESVDSNPVIVPLKVLKGHRITNHIGVSQIAWHPRLPWLISAGADGKAILWT